MTTRKGDSLDVFRDTILSRPQLTNLGIMESPGTGSMIISMYYPLFDNDRCIGYVDASRQHEHADRPFASGREDRRGIH